MNANALTAMMKTTGLKISMNCCEMDTQRLCIDLKLVATVLAHECAALDKLLADGTLLECVDASVEKYFEDLIQTGS